MLKFPSRGSIKKKNRGKLMFRKLISNVSFSPALVGQLGFYARRLKKEEATRKIGLIFTALALIVQSFVVFSPPTPANAASSNDLIQGGVSSKSQYLSHYDNNSNGLKDIYNALGVTRAELAGMTENKVIYDQSKNPTYYSWGHNPQFSYAQGERGYSIPRSSGGSFSVYTRPLKLWDANSRKVMIGHSAKLGWFAVIYNCGNLVTISYPVIQKCPTGYSGVYPNCTPPPCKYDSSIPATSPNCKAPVCPANTQGTPPNCTPIPCPDGTKGTYPNCKAPPCQYTDTITASNPECQPCPGDLTLWIKDKKCAPNLIPSKSAINITQNSKNATLIAANGGDKIEYHLNIKNTGTAAAKGAFVENLTDVAEYATLLDTGGGTYNKETHTLTWPSVTVKPGETVTRIFSIQVDKEVPVVAQGISDPISYDCKMLNTFGNSVTINVNCPAPKTVEQITTALPHTGTSENLLFAGIVLAVVGYFYARSRQLRKEVRLIRRDINVGTV